MVNFVYGLAINGVYQPGGNMVGGEKGIAAIAEAGRRRLWVMGSLLEIVIDGDQTGGSYAVAEDRSSPGFGPPPHVHEREDEAFYVIEGEYVFGSAPDRGRSSTLPGATSIGGATSATDPAATWRSSLRRDWRGCSRRLGSRPARRTPN